MPALPSPSVLLFAACSSTLLVLNKVALTAFPGAPSFVVGEGKLKQQHLFGMNHASNHLLTRPAPEFSQPHSWQSPQ